MDRRGFLRGVGAVVMAPAVVRASSLMKIVVPKQDFWCMPDFDCSIVKLRALGISQEFLDADQWSLSQHTMRVHNARIREYRQYVLEQAFKPHFNQLVRTELLKAGRVVLPAGSQTAMSWSRHCV